MFNLLSDLTILMNRLSTTRGIEKERKRETESARNYKLHLYETTNYFADIYFVCVVFRMVNDLMDKYLKFINVLYAAV